MSQNSLEIAMLKLEANKVTLDEGVKALHALSQSRQEVELILSSTKYSKKDIKNTLNKYYPLKSSKGVLEGASLDLRDVLADPSIIRVQDPNNGTLCYINIETGEKFKWTDESLVAFLPKDMSIQTWIRERSVGVHNVYKPNADTLTHTSGLSDFNTWIPPVHYKAYKESNTDVTVEMPQVYKDFFNHLFVNNESRKYVINWMTNMLNSRNLPILCLLGSTQGTGKGTFATICEHLVGHDNFAKVTDKVFTTNFNSELENRHCVLIDEVKIRSNDVAAANKIKELINETITIEGKGTNRKVIPNRASYIIASNQMNAIPLEDTDRRYSIVDITDIKLDSNIGLYSQIESNQHLTAENLMSLYIYLKKRVVESKAMAQPFRGIRFKQVQEALIPEWAITVSDFLNGSTRRLLDVQEHLRESRSVVPGRVIMAHHFSIVDRIDNGKRFFMVSEKIKRKDVRPPVVTCGDVDLPKSLKNPPVETCGASCGSFNETCGDVSNVVRGRFANFVITAQDLETTQDDDESLDLRQSHV